MRKLLIAGLLLVGAVAFAGNYENEMTERMKAAEEKAQAGWDSGVRADMVNASVDLDDAWEKEVNKVKGYWCDQLFEIVQKNGKWYLHGEDNGGWDELITVAKNGFTVEFGTKDTGDDRRFTFDTKLQTMVEIDKDGNIILPYILKDYCPTGYN